MVQTIHRRNCLMQLKGCSSTLSLIVVLLLIRPDCCLLSPHTSAWISVDPYVSLGLYLDPSEFQTAVKWRLGVNPSLSLDENPMVCPLCPTVHLTLWVTTASHAKEEVICNNQAQRYSKRDLQHLSASWFICTP